MSFRAGSCPLEAFSVEVHDVVDDVDVFSTWGTGRAGETFLPVRDGRTYRLVFTDQHRRVPGSRRFAKRWTASAEDDVDVRSLPDALDDEP